MDIMWDTLVIWDEKVMTQGPADGSAVIPVIMLFGRIKVSKAMLERHENNIVAVATEASGPEPDADGCIGKDAHCQASREDGNEWNNLYAVATKENRRKTRCDEISSHRPLRWPFYFG
jgi:hypothetical protein